MPNHDGVDPNLFSDPSSPIDPYTTAGGTRPNSPIRHTQVREFFNVVYLDSPSVAHGPTEPLRVQKKTVASSRIAGIGPSSRQRRRSTVSLPRSPRSLNMSTCPRPCPSRTNTGSTTASSVHPHHSISSIFLSLPDDPASPPPMPSKSGKNRPATNRSELHLGLGSFSLYDESAKPGLSPPSSPAQSPSRREFAPSAATRRGLPPSPLTSSRPRKAAALLGANHTVLGQRSAKRSEHFRPLPSQTLVEIERFFGNVPVKPRKVPPSLNNPKSASRPACTDGLVGQGATVRHRGEDGSMWLDVEEEQEFAWLLSEIFAAVPSPLPHLPGFQEVLWEERSDDEDQWGMTAFTSVLSKAKPKAGRKEGRSFMDLATPLPVPRRMPRLAVSDNLPWSTAGGSSGSTSLPTNHPLLGDLPPRATSRSTSPGSGSDSADSSSRRIRYRPPPLTLRTAPQTSKPTAPKLVTLGTDRPKTKQATSEQPSNPFARPRTAPRPAPSSDPVPPVPKFPAAPPVPTPLPPPEKNEAVSFFDPVTPIEPTARGRPGRWLRKVVGSVHR